MNFSSNDGIYALQQWRLAPGLDDRACAHNLIFEERLSAARIADVESFFDVNTTTPEALRRKLIDYYRERTFFDAVPQAFTGINSLAVLRDLSPEQKMLRLESISQPLSKLSIDISILQGALAGADRSSSDFLEWFCREWNERPDIQRNPVSYGAFKDENIDAYNSIEWPEKFRNQLGLAHYDGSIDEIPVALMEYDAGEVMARAEFLGLPHAFAVPTAADGTPYFQFFPTPEEMTFGSPMALVPVQSETDLIAEVLHPRLSYAKSHIAKIGVIRSSVPASDLRDMRNNQLIALRLESARDEFGEEL